MRALSVVVGITALVACNPAPQLGPYSQPTYAAPAALEPRIAMAERECPRCQVCPTCPEERRCQRVGPLPTRPEHLLSGSAGCHDPFSLCLTVPMEHAVVDYVRDLEQWAQDAQRRCGRRE